MMLDPVKPIYGIHDFNSQFIIPLSKNPPIDPIDGSVYFDTDDNQFYIHRNGVWQATIPPPEVVDLTLENGWIVSSGQPVPQRLRLTTGAVQLRGSCENPSGPLGKTITHLPSGWRPSVSIMLVCIGGSSQQNIQIDPDGAVTPVNGTGKPTGLANISFLADGN
jgi:hypothetical protein